LPCEFLISGRTKTAELQQYIDRRAKVKGVKGGTLSPATINQEIIHLRTAWNWNINMRLVPGRFPATGLTVSNSFTAAKATLALNPTLCRFNLLTIIISQ
jgi:hypothetical protein